MSSARVIVVALVCALLVQAGGTPPFPAAAANPSSSILSEPPTVTPSPVAPTPTPEPDQTPVPDGSPVPSAPPSEPTGTERVDLRTANSQTFEQTDGSFVTEIFMDDVYYQPAGRTDWQPIDTTLRPSSQDGVVASAEHGPAQLSLAAADSAAGFLSLTGGGHDMSFRLPAGAEPGRAGTQPVLMEGGKYADYTDFMPGGIGLRILPQADGFKAFLILPSRPQTTEFSFEIEAPNLDFVAIDDGSIEIWDPESDPMF